MVYKPKHLHLFMRISSCLNLLTAAPAGERFACQGLSFVDRKTLRFRYRLKHGLSAAGRNHLALRGRRRGLKNYLKWNCTQAYS
jgi:hypothetical protein